ncbi:MAG: hypothetical protein SFU86_12785 [Pirellulaceae bacterium]|nr:hypothetical protein [Pirellulaceae bacterium]
MVKQSLILVVFAAAIALTGEPAWADVAPFPRIDGASRAKLLAALAGLVILGFGMVGLIWLGARMAQRYRHGGAPLHPTPRPGEKDWAAKPLAGPPEKPVDR